MKGREKRVIKKMVRGERKQINELVRRLQEEGYSNNAVKILVNHCISSKVFSLTNVDLFVEMVKDRFNPEVADFYLFHPQFNAFREMPPRELRNYYSFHPERGRNFELKVHNGWNHFDGTLDSRKNFVLYLGGKPVFTLGFHVDKDRKKIIVSKIQRDGILHVPENEIIESLGFRAQEFLLREFIRQARNLMDIGYGLEYELLVSKIRPKEGENKSSIKLMEENVKPLLERYFKRVYESKYGAPGYLQSAIQVYSLSFEKRRVKELLERK